MIDRSNWLWLNFLAEHVSSVQTGCSRLDFLCNQRCLSGWGGHLVGSVRINFTIIQSEWAGKRVEQCVLSTFFNLIERHFLIYGTFKCIYFIIEVSDVERGLHFFPKSWHFSVWVKLDDKSNSVKGIATGNRLEIKPPRGSRFYYLPFDRNSTLACTHPYAQTSISLSRRQV